MRKAALVHALIFVAFIGLGTSATAGAQTIPYIWTVAGDGLDNPAGYQNGVLAMDATLVLPTALARDKYGNLYVATYGDIGGTYPSGSTMIRKIDPKGFISNFAGTQVQGDTGDGGPALSATFGDIECIIFDTAGNMYVSDKLFNVVRKIDITGTISTVAGKLYKEGLGYIGDGGAATAAELHSPVGLAFDSQGNLYIADSANHVVRKVNTTGRISTVIGNHTEGYSGDGGPASSAELGTPQELAFDSAGNLYISDNTDNGCARSPRTRPSPLLPAMELQVLPAITD